MEITLQMLDEVRTRTGASYEKVVEALRATNGDVVESIVLLEREKDDVPLKGELYEQGSKVVTKLKDLVAQGNNIRVKIKQEDDTVIELPATVGVLSAVVAPALAIVGAAACLATKCSVEIENRNKADGKEPFIGPEVGS